MKFIFVLLLSFSLQAHAKNFQEHCQELLSSKGKSTEAKRLHALFDFLWDYDMHEFPEWATQVGYPGQNDRWSDQSLETIERHKNELACPLKILRSIDRKKLSKEDQLNYDLFLYSTEQQIEGNKFPNEYLAINQMQGPHGEIVEMLMDMPKNTQKDYEDRIARLEKAPKLLEQNQTLLEIGVKKGITPPKEVLGKLPEQFDRILKDKVEESPLYESFKELPTIISTQAQQEIRTKAKKVIEDLVYPALKTYKKFLVQEYLPHVRTTTGWKDLPNGQAWYAYNIKSMTTTSLSAEEIHALGLKEVERIHKEMEKIRAQVGFKGDLKEFYHFLETDKRFYFTSGEDLITHYRDIAKQIDPELPRIIGQLPRLPYGVKPVPEYAAMSAPVAYYQDGTLETGRPGIFYANPFDLKANPKWQMRSLVLHEAVPGHHLQIAIAQEQGNLPNFRKHSFFTAYTEGWGLYAETLGDELGMYKDPYDKFGQLTMEIWRAIRLVVDTGLHSKGWTRQQAIDYFGTNTPKSDHDVEVEVDRYIVWPGQALAYKVGQLKIQALRDKAKAALGDKFEVRKFHDTILQSGALPLDLLAAQVDRWIATQKGKK